MDVWREYYKTLVAYFKRDRYVEWNAQPFLTNAFSNQLKEITAIGARVEQKLTMLQKVKLR